MQVPLKITFRHMDPSPSLESRIREEVAKLEQFHEHIVQCTVVLETPHRHHHKGKLYHLRIDLKTRGKELLVSREHHDKHAHEEAYVVIRDAFSAMRRQLEDHARRHRSKVKTHEVPLHGRVSELIPMQDYGKITTSEGREIYFHRNSLLNAAYDKLTEGSEVKFVEERGDEGPQASTVMLLGKHHILG